MCNLFAKGNPKTVPVFGRSPALTNHSPILGITG
jgi:hypothetical protein